MATVSEYLVWELKHVCEVNEVLACHAGYYDIRLEPNFEQPTQEKYTKMPIRPLELIVPVTGDRGGLIQQAH